MTIRPRDDLIQLIRQYDQPFSDSSALPSLAISRVAREHVTVVLTGDGGDEVFCGYRRYVAARAAGRLSWLPKPLAATAAHAFGDRGKRRSSMGFLNRFLRSAKLPLGQRYLAFTSDMLDEREKRSAWLGQPMRSTEEWIESVIPS